MSIFNIEVERNIIGALLLNPKNLDEVSDKISPSDFYDNKNKVIFEAMLSLQEEKIFIDIFTVSDKLGADPKFSGMSDNYLIDLAKDTYAVSNINEHVRILHDFSRRRKLNEILDEIHVDIANKDKGSEILINEAESKIFNLGAKESKKGPEKISDILPQLIEEIDILRATGENITGLKTGFEELDKITLGLQKSTITVIAARTSMGKTTFALNVAENIIVNENKTVLFFSTEMTKKQLLMKMSASLGKIPVTNINIGKLDEKDWDRFHGVIERLIFAPLFIDDSSGISVAQIGSRARRLCKDHNLALIVIDYLQLLQPSQKFNNKTQEIGDISRSLKLLAMDLEIPILVVAQLNREPDKRIDKKPFMSDLRDSGCIEQDADVILLLNQPFVYSQDESQRGQAELIICKNRYGSTGTIKLSFDGFHSRFNNHSYYP